MTDKTELFKCDYCMLTWEGIESKECPKCHQHFFHLVARYPTLKETYEEDKQRLLSQAEV